MIEWIKSGIPPELLGVLVAMATSVLRMLSETEERPTFRGVLLDMGTCGALAVGVAGLVHALGVDGGWLVFSGAAIGHLGPVTVRRLALRYFAKRTDSGG